MDDAVSSDMRAFLPDAVQSGSELALLQKAMLDATPDCIKLVSVDGALLTMNRAGCLALGVAEDSAFGMPWLPLLPEEEHALGHEALRRAAAGQSARFPGKSLSTQGIVYWDNLLTPLIDAADHVVSILCIARDVTDKTLLERRLQEGAEREHLLSREMQHRIKNLLSVVSGLTLFSEKEAVAMAHPERAMTILRDKLDALSRASDAVFVARHSSDAQLAHLDVVVGAVLEPYGDRCKVVGDPLPVRRDLIIMLALFLHELATNSVKYGALGQPAGLVTVSWVKKASGLDLTWSETGGPAITQPPQRRGFGSQMLDRILQISRGAIERHWRLEGLVVEISMADCLDE